MSAKQHSPAEAAALVGVTGGRLRQLARQTGAGTMIGSMRVYTEADIETLKRARRKPPGRPKQP